MYKVKVIFEKLVAKIKKTGASKDDDPKTVKALESIQEILQKYENEEMNSANTQRMSVDIQNAAQGANPGISLPIATPEEIQTWGV